MSNGRPLKDEAAVYRCVADWNLFLLRYRSPLPGYPLLYHYYSVNSRSRQAFAPNYDNYIVTPGLAFQIHEDQGLGVDLADTWKTGIKDPKVVVGSRFLEFTSEEGRVRITW